MLKCSIACLLLVSVSAVPAIGAQGETQAVDTGDTAWVLMSSALVLLMTIPGLAFFYGGLVRRKNILSVLMQCFVMACLVTLQWVLFGYSMAFGPDAGSLIGTFAWAGLKGVGQDPCPAYAATIPHQAFMVFQMMFAVITPALIAGAFAERMKFSAFSMFSLLWTCIVYDPVAHWVWGVGGFLREWGALDFAGGTVVHINAGIAALMCARVLGKRLGYPHKMPPPHNLPFAALGAGLLWFGWFGFNGGSALGANGLASNALMVTHIAAAMGGATWAAMDWLVNRRPTVLGMITGAVAGLVAITPAAGYVGVDGALWIGFGAGTIPFVMVAVVKPRLGYDDALDAFGVHGIGGLWGAVATGIWASRAVNPAGADGLLHGNPLQLLIQVKAAAVVLIYSLAASWAVLKLVDLFVGLRASDEAERIGLDLTDHREAGYTMLE